MNEIYQLHEKATNLLELVKAMENRINDLQNNRLICAQKFPQFNDEYLSDINTCLRGLERLKTSYLRIINKISSYAV